jgi:hypothetical protein
MCALQDTYAAVCPHRYDRFYTLADIEANHMLHILSAMGYGDCLITLSLLEKLELASHEYQIVGTTVTERVSALLNKPLSIIPVLADAAAFYTIKQHGPWKALIDMVTVQQALGRLSRQGDTIAFERRDLRSVIIKPRGCHGIYAPQTHRAYKDRQALVRQLFGRVPEWAPTRKPGTTVKSILINPCARYGNRWLAHEIMENVVSIAAEQRWAITLLDPCGRYGTFSSQVSCYEREISLSEAAALLKSSDLYIGPDSFFIHLAYYYRVPFFGFFFSHYHDFLAPGMEQLGNFMDFEAARNRYSLEKKLMAFVDLKRDSHDA